MDEPDLAELFHENAKTRPEAGPVPGAVEGGSDLALTLMDQSIKRYAARGAIQLPAPRPECHVDLYTAIRRRSAERAFCGSPVPLVTLADLLHYGVGIRAVASLEGYRDYRRNAPSAGNLGSVDIYPVVFRVDDLAPGAYHYQPLDHQLVRLVSGDLSEPLAAMLLQPKFQQAAAILILGSSLGRVKAKYGIRGYRYACLDAGHVAQNLCLSATALGLGACPLGSFDDDRMNRLLGLNGVDEAALYAVALGFPEAGPNQVT